MVFAAELVGGGPGLGDTYAVIRQWPWRNVQISVGGRTFDNLPAATRFATKLNLAVLLVTALLSLALGLGVPIALTFVA